MQISGPQLKALQAALIDAFPTRPDLEMMVTHGLNENLSALAGSGGLEHTVFELLRWAKAHGKLEELIKAAISQNSGNAQLGQVAVQLGVSHDQALSSYPATSILPEMGKYFLESQDREYLIKVVDSVISPMSIDGIKNLLRGKLSESRINRINYREGSRNVAESMISSLESGGAQNPLLYHVLGAFLRDLVVADGLISYDAGVRFVALLFRYTLVKEREQIAQLSAQFQVPSPTLTEELLISHPLSLAPLPANTKARNWRERLETLYHRRRYLLNVNFLIAGAKAARSVCRIDFEKRGEGTGFLVAPDLILTNFHVLMPPGYGGDLDARARRCEVRFGVIEDADGTVRAGSYFKLHAQQWLIIQSPPEELDFMLLRLHRPVTLDEKIYPLAVESHLVQADDFVNIIQHPGGGRMEVSLRFNQVVDVGEKRMYYLADTEEGSSGSPVFNDRWQVVGLHRSGGELDEAGNLVMVANSGVPIDAIRKQIADYLNK